MDKVMSAQMTSKITDIVLSYINNFATKDKKLITESLQILLNGNFQKYNLNLENTNFTSKLDLQKQLYKLNEKSNFQKQAGVYYTPEDVCKYIIYNSIIMLLEPQIDRTFKEQDAFNYISQLNHKILYKFLFELTFIDPTCGSSEFLINLFNIKYQILCKINSNYTDNDILNISKTIFGNDIQEDSTDISKIRLFFEICYHFKDSSFYTLLAKALKKNFTNFDYVLYNNQFNNKFDCVIGNPPYVEYRKYESRCCLTNDFGNIYADVIKNSLNTLKQGGVLGFVVPLSYISTSRMNPIRNFVIENTNRQFILSFADRPDCLFQGVHQKLNILFARKGKQGHALFTSNYQHWYKEERNKLLNGCQLQKNHHIGDMFIPKIANQIEENIYKKIFTTSCDNIYDLQRKEGISIFLNARATFWIKAFSFNPGSKEYKEFKFDKEISPFIKCVLNSSLFWTYWIIISDCWHITSKELKGFYIPKLDNYHHDLCEKLINNLENGLEKTKKYIGSKQTEYEYKHKQCKAEIDEIDDFLAKIYNISARELDYVKSFALKYRVGGGAND